MVGSMVGRSDEIGSVSSLLDDGEPSPRGVLIEGEAGIGKTTLWRESVRLARQRGLRVIAAAPAESETALPFSALADLLADARDGDTPARATIDAAIAGEQVEHLAVSRAAVDLMAALAADGPLVIALDDVQWLDPPTESVLTFAFRRIADLPVRVLAARRSTETSAAPLGLDRTLDERLDRLRLGPMGIGDLDRLVRARLDLRLSRPALAKLHRTSGGNPFYALEIARTLSPENGDELSIPAHLGGVVESRLGGLSDEAADAVLLAAACLQPTSSIIERATGGHAGIAAAIDAGVLELERDRLRFTHPLLGSIAYESAAPWVRRDAHARLARTTASLERAHHLARAVDQPDEDAALEIADAAAQARSRGASELAAELADHAVRLTPAGSPSSFERALEAALTRVTAGDPYGARTRLEQLVDSLPRGLQRAQALAHLGDLSEYRRGLELGMQALEEAADDPITQINIHLMMSIFLWNQGELDRYFEHARAAVAMAEEAGDTKLLALAYSDLVQSEALVGVPFTQEKADRMLALERDTELGLSSFLRPSLKLASIYMAIDQLDEARRILGSEIRRVEASGDEAIRWGLLARLADVELRAGNLGAALSHAQAAIDTRLFGEEPHPYAMVPYARVLAQLGDLEAARTAAIHALQGSRDVGNHILGLRARALLGFIAWCEDQPHDALEELRPVVADLRRMGFSELSIFGAVENALEALVAIGAIDEAEEVARWVEEMGRPADRSWHRAVAARGFALVASERGDVDLARARIAEAFEAHASLPQPFELGRTLLAQGRIERRAKNRRPSREAFTRALDLFDEMGAARFAEIAASELARIPGRAPASGELSETERRVAELAASGLSNKEIAAQLFMAVRTVESNLTKIYGKLGVRSRSQLARAL